MKNHFHFKSRIFGSIICCFVKINLIFCQDLIINSTPESYPGALDGRLEISVQDVGFGIGQNSPPFNFSLTVLGEDPQLISNSSGEAIYTNLGYNYYCLRVINGSNCHAQTCFQFDKPCSDDCLIADFDFTYTSDGCALQFYDWSQGDATSWEWDFGDGTNSSEQNPLHTYSESRCYNVTLEATNGSLSREISKEVCISTCTDDNSPAPDCQINAPTFAAAGQTINLNIAGTGIAPFDYEWTTSGFINPMPNNFSPSISALIPSTANNGDQYNFYVQLSDYNDNSTTCAHTVTIGGNPPDVEVTAFGSFQENQPLVLVAFVDIFNLTGLEDYFFTIEGEEQSGSCLNSWQPFYNCVLENGLSQGIYELCVTVRDDAGTYKDCISINIGGATEPPPSPKMYLEIKAPSNPLTDPTTLHYILESGSNIRIGVNGSHPHPGHPLPCTQEEYYVVLHCENLTTGQNFSIGDPVGGDPKMNSMEGGVPGVGLDWYYVMGQGCTNGTLAITADVYNIRCDEFAFPPDIGNDPQILYEITEPIFIDLHPKKPTISEISINNNGCEFPMNVTLFSSCGIASYEWHVYDPISNEEIQGFFTGNTNAATVYPDLNHDMYFQYLSGAVVRFRCKVIVVDVNGFTSEHTSILMMRVPLRIDLPTTIYRCPGVESHFSEVSIAAGGINRYEYTWSVIQPVGGTLDFASNDLHDPNPLFTSPLSGSKQYKLVVKNLNEYGEMVCQVEKFITVSVSELVFDWPDFTWPICATSGREIGPSEDFLSTLGGSGSYAFEWSPTTYLSDPTAPNPILSGLSIDETINYSVTITDIYGGCTASDNIVVRGVANSHTVSLSGPSSVCYGDEIVLNAVGSPVDNTPPFGNIFNQYLWTTTNPKHDLSGIGTNITNLPVNEIVSSHPGGPYTYTVRYQNIATGCFAEASVNVSIRKPLKYQGYNSAIKYVVQEAGVPSSVPLWEGGNTDLNFVFSGIGNQGVTVQWFPFVPTDIVLGSFGIPKNAMFVPTIDAPYLTMEITDNATGCKKTFKSIRYIISQAQPELWIAADNPYFCLNGWICFDIVLDAHLADYQTSLLPEKVTLSIAFDAPANSPQQPDHIYSTVDLKLENSSGIYKGQICEGDFFKSPTTFDPYTIDATTTGLSYNIWGYLNCDMEINISGQVPAPASVTKCLPMANSVLAKAVKFDFGLQCANNWSVSNDGGSGAVTMASDYIEFHPDGEIEIVPNPSAGNNMGRLFVINPCIVPQFQSPDPDESPTPPITANRAEEIKLTPISTVVTLEVFPNPFTGEVNIQYTLPPECNEEAIINLLDITGKHLRTIEKRKSILGGQFEIIFDGKYLPPGVYFYELAAGNCRKIKKAVKIGF